MGALVVGSGDVSHRCAAGIQRGNADAVVAEVLDACRCVVAAGRTTRRCLPPQQAGFLLPLSLTVVLLLMLSSMMLLTLALQSRLQPAVQRQRRLAEDS